MRYIFLILISCFAFAGEGGDAPKLPADVQAVVDKHDLEVAKAKAAYDLAVSKANDAGAKAMEAVIKAKATKGDIDGAMVAKNIVREWQKDEGDLLGEKTVDVAKMILGKWQQSTDAGRVWVFSANKTFTSKSDVGTWEVKEGLVVVTCPAYGWTNTIKISDEKTACGKRADGSEFTLARMK